MKDTRWWWLPLESEQVITINKQGAFIIQNYSGCAEPCCEIVMSYLCVAVMTLLPISA